MVKGVPVSFVGIPYLPVSIYSPPAVVAQQPSGWHVTHSLMRTISWRPHSLTHQPGHSQYYNQLVLYYNPYVSQQNRLTPVDWRRCFVTFASTHLSASIWYIAYMMKWYFYYFLAATKQLYKWYFPSVCPSVRPSVCLSHLFHHVPIIVSSWNFQELLPWSKVMSMQKVKVRGQRSRSQRSTPNLAVSGL